MLVHAQRPAYWWYYALKCATWLINRLPTSANEQHISPYAKLTGKHYDHTRSRTWGCPCYRHNGMKPGLTRTKADPHMFVGYSESGYLCYNPASNRIVTASLQMLTFDESFTVRKSLNIDKRMIPDLVTYDPAQLDLKVTEPDPYYRFTDTAKRARITDTEITDRRLRPRKTNTDTDKPHTVTDNTDIQHTENNSTADRKRRMRLEQQQAYRQQIQKQQKEYEEYIKQKHPVSNDSDSDTTDDEDIDPDHPGYKIVSRVILNDLRVRVVPMENLQYMVHAVQTIEAAMPGDKIDMSYNIRQPSLKLALSSFERDKWIAAMEQENKSLKDKGTYRVVYYDKGNVPYTPKSMWVLTKKYDEKGKLICYKARCVIKGYTQEHGVHYD